MRRAILFALVLRGAGCATAYERRVRELAPGVRREVAELRRVLPEAPIAFFATDRPSAFGAYGPDGVIRVVEQDLDALRARDPAIDVRIAGCLAHELTHEIQDRRKRLPPAAYVTFSAAVEGEAQLVAFFVKLRRSGRPSLGRVGLDLAADRRIAPALRLECETLAPDGDREAAASPAVDRSV